MTPDQATGPPYAELTIVGLIARARSLIRPGRRTILGITGPPGTGKSTAAEALAQALAGAAVVVGMDGFHLAQSELARLARQARKGAPDTFDAFGYAALLRRLRENADPVVYAPAFRRDLDEPVGSCIPVGRDMPLVITEGNYLLLDAPGWTLARQQLDEVWYLDLPDDIRLDYLTRRHQSFGKDPGAARAWATGTDQSNALIVRTSRDAADLIVRLTRS